MLTSSIDILIYILSLISSITCMYAYCSLLPNSDVLQFYDNNMRALKEIFAMCMQKQCIRVFENLRGVL